MLKANKPTWAKQRSYMNSTSDFLNPTTPHATSQQAHLGQTEDLHELNIRFSKPNNPLAAKHNKRNFEQRQMLESQRALARSWGGSSWGSTFVPGAWYYIPPTCGVPVVSITCSIAMCSSVACNKPPRCIVVSFGIETTQVHA